MKVKVFSEYGFSGAMLGLSLSHNRPVEDMWVVANKLYNKDGGHNKFLRFMYVTLDITASRSWWQQMSTYCVGVSVQSESTMHTLTKKKLTQDNFERSIPDVVLSGLNEAIENKNLIEAKDILPESFLQRRIVSTNYMALRSIIKQRELHKLPEWQMLIGVLLTSLEHGEFFNDLRKGYYNE